MSESRRRVTISHIAERAVSRRARSRTRSTGGRGCRTRHASGSSRSRDELGWYPNRAARALSAARANACGLVLARPREDARARAVLHGVHRRRRVGVLGASIALTIQLAEDVARRRSRSTAAGGASGGSTACSSSTCARTTRASKPSRSSACRPSSSAARSKTGVLPSVWHDERSAIVESGPLPRSARSHRGSRGWRVPGEFVHTAMRTARLRGRSRRSSGSGRGRLETDYTPRERRARDAPAPLRRPSRRRAIVYDSDVLAVARPRRRAADGLSRCPSDVSIVAWDDSLICQVVHPPLTAVSRDIPGLRRAATGRLLLAAIDGDADGDRRDAARRADGARQHGPPHRRVAAIRA